MKFSVFAVRKTAAAAFLVLSGLCASVSAEVKTLPVLIVSSGAADVTTLDPDRATNYGDMGVVSEIFNGLVRFAPGSSDVRDLQPDLAQRWESSADKKVWTFYLRKGVQFHAGYGELKAADVVYSMKRAADPTRSSFAADFALLEKVEAIDDYTVRVTLKYPDAAFPERMSNYHGGYIVSQAATEKLGKRFGQSPVGTGPFAFDQIVTQQYVKLVANDAYFRGAPKLGGIIYRMILSDSARELAVTTNEIDLMGGKREQRWVARARGRGIGVDVFSPAEFRTLFINRKIKPLDNLKVRQAIASAINVDQIVRYAGADVAEKGCSVVPNGYLGGDCSAGIYTYDVARSKKLLAEAGFPDGITLHSVVSSVSAQLPIMEIVQAQLAQAGIKLEMEVVDHATYQSKSRHDQSALVFYGAARFPDSNSWLTEFYDSAASIGAPGAMSNFAHCSVADKEIRAARVEPDAEKQLALWKQAQREIHDDVCAVPLFGLKQVWAQGVHVDLGYQLKGAMNLQPPITELTTVTRSTP
ncbi:ABC transporter substrate-binding protein [Paraburkholderia xenovorans]|jgi:peptide/nickel transport system substrate-binding protein